MHVNKSRRHKGNIDYFIQAEDMTSLVFFFDSSFFLVAYSFGGYDCMDMLATVKQF